MSRHYFVVTNFWRLALIIVALRAEMAVWRLSTAAPSERAQKKIASAWRIFLGGIAGAPSSKLAGIALSRVCFLSNEAVNSARPFVHGNNRRCRDGISS